MSRALPTLIVITLAHGTADWNYTFTFVIGFAFDGTALLRIVSESGSVECARGDKINTVVPFDSALAFAIDNDDELATFAFDAIVAHIRDVCTSGAVRSSSSRTALQRATLDLIDEATRVAQ